ncbi:MAG: MBL fold metallo-hydrolase [Promethearchaeota archaeon]
MIRDSKHFPKKMGVSLDFGPFIIVRPRRKYRENSGIIILKGDHPVLIDVGTSKEPGISSIKYAFKKHKINPDSVGYIFLTHSHQDHTLNLHAVQKLCRNSKTICSKKDYPYIQHPVSMPRSWNKALKLLGKDKVFRIIYTTLAPPSFMLYYRTVRIYPKIDYTMDLGRPPKDFNLNNLFSLKIDDELNLKFIPTSGHSAGHYCILDNHKDLFLGDFVPFTPWINPLAEALDDVVQSIKNLLKLKEDDVKFAVRSHGDIRRKCWEVAPWADERARFEFFLETIEESLEKIPKFLKKRPMSTEEITSLLIPHYRRYSFIMNVLFIPPSITWILAYCQKLEELGKIKRIENKNRIKWSL